MNAKEKKRPSKAAKGGGKAAGFTDANAKWLTPKLPSKAALRAAEKEAAVAMQAAEAGAPSDGGSDSEDVPLPGELDAGDSDIGLESPSGSEDEGGCYPDSVSPRTRGDLYRSHTWIPLADDLALDGDGLSISSDGDDEDAEGDTA